MAELYQIVDEVRADEPAPTRDNTLHIDLLSYLTAQIPHAAFMLSYIPITKTAVRLLIPHPDPPPGVHAA